MTSCEPTRGMAQVLALLEANGRMTVAQLAEARECLEPSTFRVLQRLRKHDKARIAAWRRPIGRGTYAALWAAGSEPDAPRPRRRTSAERNRRYRERNARQISLRRYGVNSPYASVWGGLLK